MNKLLVSFVLPLLLLSACSREASDTANKGESSTATSAPPQSTPPAVDKKPDPELVARAGAPLLRGLGNFTHPITTNDPGAQRYFDQGMMLTAGFNHAEAIRSFQAAQRLDPDCAMCFWGEALALGPNINVTSRGQVVMRGDDRIKAYNAILKAQELAAKTTQKEQDYIQALSTRYDGDPESDRHPMDLAYAESMRQLAHKYPDDDDAQALFAEAMMNTMPWDYWLDGNNPKPETAEVINTLETVMARNPRHPLALHLYIHAVEASSKPERAETAADTLAALVPGSGHLVHMPSHIYWRIGRYEDASEANVRAAKVDEDYIAQCNAQGFYPAMYYPHNIHFLWASSSMEGRSEVAIAAGEKVAANVRLDQIKQYPVVEFFQTIPLLSLVRFARWEDILARPAPPENLQYSNAIWHYARAVALARTGKLEAAQAEIDAMQPLMQNEAIYFLDGSDYPATHILGIAELLARGELALARGDRDTAILAFGKAVEIQDQLPYTEPPFWYYPTRQSLGHALLQQGDFANAEAVYRKDLEQYPRNGWSLKGLSLALAGQGKQEEARQAEKQFETIWQRADVKLDSSVL